jgi:hypothetical protein
MLGPAAEEHAEEEDQHPFQPTTADQVHQGTYQTPITDARERGISAMQSTTILLLSNAKGFSEPAEQGSPL